MPYGRQSRQVRSPDPTQRHGFSIVLAGGKSEEVFIVSSFQCICEEHNFCIMRELAVYRSQDEGRMWVKMRNGLPHDVHCCILRDAMAADNPNSAGVYLETTTGEIYGSRDGGETWFLMARGVDRIQGVSSLVPP